MALETFAFTDRAIQIIAEDKIQTAIRNGLFDNLPGLGEPFSWCDEPYDPNWWIRQKIKDEKLQAERVHEWTLIREGKDVVERMIEYHKQFVDRDKLRANLKLTVTERLAQLQEKARSHNAEGKPVRRTSDYEAIAELECLLEERPRLGVLED